VKDQVRLFVLIALYTVSVRQMRSIIKCATPLSNYLHPTPNISTNMDPIQAAIEAIESRDPGEDFSYN